MMAIKTFMTNEDDKAALQKVETVCIYAKNERHVEGEDPEHTDMLFKDEFEGGICFTLSEIEDFKKRPNSYKFILKYTQYFDMGAHHETFLVNSYVINDELYFEALINLLLPEDLGGNGLFRYIWKETTHYDEYETTPIHFRLISNEHLALTGYTEAPCLIQGTPINMADGIEKPIEFVRKGDIVLSYDPNTNTQVPAVVLDAYPTGAERKYTVYNFSNGRHLTIFGLHGYYDKVSGTTQDIREINRDKRLIDIAGNTIQWAGSRDRYFAGQKKVRYNLITSNNLYYANGILLGSRPYNKLQYFLDRNLPLPEEIKAVWQQDCDDHNAYDDVISDASFYAEVAEDYQELAKAKNIIRVNKKRLERTDYQNAKQVEGLLTDEEWNTSKDKRARYRKEINDNESIYKERLSHVNEVITRYRKDITAKTIFNTCCERDNAIFETVKAYFTSNNNK